MLTARSGALCAAATARLGALTCGSSTRGMPGSNGKRRKFQGELAPLRHMMSILQHAHRHDSLLLPADLSPDDFGDLPAFKDLHRIKVFAVWGEPCPRRHFAPFVCPSPLFYISPRCQHLQRL